jgi:hypothetical protein
MNKKIKLKYYKLGDEVCVVDYNDLKVSYYGNNGHRYNLLGGISDRIEPFLMRRGYIKTTILVFEKIKNDGNI